MTEKTLIICEEYQKERLLRTLTSYGMKTDLTGYRFSSLSSLLKEDAAEEEVRTLLEFAHILRTPDMPLPVYGRMLKYPVFLREMLAFARECCLYGIRPEDLPSEAENERELAYILSCAMQLPLKEKDVFAKRDRLLEEIAASAILLPQTFIRHPFAFRFLEDLKKRADRISYLKKETDPETEDLRYALSTRQEIEAAAQDICRHGQKCNIILTEPSAQLPVLEQVFSRYGIPFSPLIGTATLRCLPVFLSLVTYALRKDDKSFLQALRLNAFSSAASAEIIRFAERTGTVDDTTLPENSLFPQEKKRQDKLAERYGEWLSRSEEERNILLAAASPADAFRAAWKVLQAHPLMRDVTQLNAGLRIRNILNQALPMIRDEDDAMIVLDLIAGASVTAVDMSTDFCTVTDLSHPADAAEYSYVLGCSAKSWPGVPSRKGVFDEDYAGKISSFPSLEERHTAWMRQLEWVMHSGTHLVFSYATNDYQGRNIEPAFEIVSRMEQKNIRPSAWKTDVLYPYREKEHRLDPDTASELFTEDDGRIHGSISRFERWFLCPYSYFLASGLKARRDDVTGLDAASIGTIQHALMEDMVRTYGKDFSTVREEDVNAWLTPWFEEMKQMRPHEAFEIELTKQRMAYGLFHSLRYLDKAGKDTIFRPYAQEHRFEHEIIPGIILRGIIDRIDVSGDLFRVIDYKSSEHKLSETAVKAGTQLQLLSYIMAAEKDLNRQPEGAYYFSTQVKASGQPAGSFKTKGISDMDSLVDPEALYEGSRKLLGWSFDPFELNDTEFKSRYSGALYSIDLIRKCLYLLYSYLQENLLAGVIQVDPTEDACKFCDFAAVCRTRGGVRKAVPVVMADEKLKPGKEEA